jgi:hypothetical protein
MDPDLVEGLERLRERDGTSASESVRRAVRRWLDRKGILTGPSNGALPWDAPESPLVSPQEERALDEADMELLLRALRRLRVGGGQEGRRQRLTTQLEREISDLTS